MFHRQKKNRGESSGSGPLPSFDEVRFKSKENQVAYGLYSQCGFNDSKPLLQANLSFDIISLFHGTLLESLFALNHPFHSNLIFLFFANLKINSTFTTASSYVNQIDVEITADDLNTYFSLPTTGPKPNQIASSQNHDWTIMNNALRNATSPYHYPKIQGLSEEARIIQHIIRTNLIPKAGDRSNITPLISACTYYCLTHQSFNVADVIFNCLHNLTSINHPLFRKKTNLYYGSLIANILERKYNISSPHYPDHNPIPFTDQNFYSFFKKKRPQAPQHIEEEEEEETGEQEAPEEIPASPRLSRSQSHRPSSSHTRRREEDMIERFSRLETKLDTFIDYSHERWDAFEAQQASEHSWLESQFDFFRSNWPPQNPPDA